MRLKDCKGLISNVPQCISYPLNITLLLNNKPHLLIPCLLTYLMLHYCLVPSFISCINKLQHLCSCFGRNSTSKETPTYKEHQEICVRSNLSSLSKMSFIHDILQKEGGLTPFCVRVSGLPFGDQKGVFLPLVYIHLLNQGGIFVLLNT